LLCRFIETSETSIIISLVSISSYAVEITGGFKVGAAKLEGTDKTNSRSASQDETTAFGAVWVETAIPNSPVVVGLEYIPLNNKIDVTNSTTSGTYEVTAKNHATLYLQATTEVAGNTVFGKVGYVYVDLGNAKSTTQTLTSSDSSAEGYTVGLGVQKDISSGQVDFVRFGIDYIDYGSVEAKSASTTYKGDADAYTAYVSFGKKF
jgi:hypothetical protein